MGLNGGAYTFIQPFDWSSLNNADFQAMFQDRTSLLVRARKTDGTQPYGILKQLLAYSNSALNVGLNTNAPYTDPVNYASMGSPSCRSDSTRPTLQPSTTFKESDVTASTSHSTTARPSATATSLCSRTSTNHRKRRLQRRMWTSSIRSSPTSLRIRLDV